MRIRNHASRLTALLLLALCAQMLLPSQAPSAYATETSIEDFGPSLGVYPNRDYTGLYKIDAQILAHDAAQAIQAAVDLGLCESAADLELERAVPLGGETIYQLRQVYEGIPVLNRRATVLTDAQGVVRAAGGDCVPLEGINTQPALGWAEIAQALSAYLRGAHHLAEGASFSEEAARAAGELAIYVDEAATPHLAYAVHGGAWEAVIDASNGEVLRFAETMSTLGEMALDTYPWQAELPYDEASGLYVLRDEARCFEVYDAQDNLVVLIMGNDDDPLIEMHDYVERNSLDYMVDWLFDYGETGITTSVGMLDEPIALSDPNSAEEVWRQAYASMALAYDYFYHVLGWDGFNGARGKIKIVCNTDGVIMGNDIKGDNAAMLSGAQAGIMVYMGEVGRIVAAEPNTAVHEYAHGVEYSISSIMADSTAEGAGVKEALSDVFAELAEAYATSRDPDWINAVRQCYPGGAGALYHYGELQSGVDGHDSSTIASYALYQLWQAWREDMQVAVCMDRMSHLLFRALFLLPHDASFFDLAYALRTSGLIMQQNGELSLKQYDQLCTALQSVGLLKQESTCLVAVTDPNGAPIEGARVALFTGDDDSAPVLEEDYWNGGMSVVMLRTNENGLCNVRLFDDGADYRIVVEAEGYEAYSGWAGTIVEQTATGDVQFLVNRVQLWPEGSEPGAIPVAEFDESLLLAQLRQLAEQYGAIPVGAEAFASSGNADPIPAGRLSGLLGADLYDYDGDGQRELLAVRLDTRASEPPASAETRCYLSMYDWNPAAAAVELADEISFSLASLTGTEPNAALHTARGAFGEGEAALYIDYYYDFNSRGFATVSLYYDGAFRLGGGVECDEFYAWCSCYRAAELAALSSLLSSQMGGRGSGWGLVANYNWEETSANPSPEAMDSYGAHYRELLSAIRLEELYPRSMWLDNPARPDPGEYTFENRDAYIQGLAAQQQYDREIASLRLDERCRALDGTLTALCGLSRFAATSAEGGVALDCYDASGLLDSYR